MRFVELIYEDIRNAENLSEAYALILKEKDGEKFIPIMIGMNEARTLVLVINKEIPRRPTPLDLFKTLADTADYRLLNVCIYKCVNGVFFSLLKMINQDFNIIEIDSRTSDAITLAYKWGVPIFITEELFNEVAIQTTLPSEEALIIEPDEFVPFDEKEERSEDKFIDQQLSEMNNEELSVLLEGAIESDDFELALKIQNEMEKRK